jgi:hypothetical protein
MIWQWLQSTVELQTEIYGYDLRWMQDARDQGDYGPLAEYIDKWWGAAIMELAEAREEYSWKPWATDSPFVNEQRVLEELVDLQHFIGNILVGMGVSEHKFWAEYRKKQQKNRERQASGTYSAQKGGLAMGSEV